MTNVLVCDSGCACTQRSSGCIVTVFTKVMGGIRPPVAATMTFDLKDVEWGHTGSDSQRITLQLDANLKPTHITEGTRTFPMDLWT